MRRDDLELLVGAILKSFIGAPAAELRQVAKSRPLHVFVRYFHDQLWS